MTDKTVGFIGLGNMGGPMAVNMAKAFPGLVVYDAAGTKDRAPEHSEPAASTAAVATAADVVFLSLPDGPVVAKVAEEIIAANSRRTFKVIDLSTIGIKAAEETAARLGGAGIAFHDCPVSGGTAGAIAGTVAVMFAGPADTYAELEPLLASIGKPFHVGEKAGQGQAMKLLNNFLSATAMAATSEAVAFGEQQGLDMALMLDVLNVSSGQNTATSDKFPRRILPGKFDAGFTTALMAKDVALYHEAAKEAGRKAEVSAAVDGIWSRFRKADPDCDFTLIYPFLKDGK